MALRLAKTNQKPKINRSVKQKYYGSVFLSAIFHNQNATHGTVSGYNAFKIRYN